LNQSILRVGVGLIFALVAWILNWWKYLSFHFLQLVCMFVITLNLSKSRWATGIL